MPLWTKPQERGENCPSCGPHPRGRSGPADTAVLGAPAPLQGLGPGALAMWPFPVQRRSCLLGLYRGNAAFSGLSGEARPLLRVMSGLGPGHCLCPQGHHRSEGCCWLSPLRRDLAAPRLLPPLPCVPLPTTPPSLSPLVPLSLRPSLPVPPPSPLSPRPSPPLSPCLSLCPVPLGPASRVVVLPLRHWVPEGLCCLVVPMDPDPSLGVCGAVHVNPRSALVFTEWEPRGCVRGQGWYPRLPLMLSASRLSPRTESCTASTHVSTATSAASSTTTASPILCPCVCSCPTRTCAFHGSPSSAPA